MEGVDKKSGIQKKKRLMEAKRTRMGKKTSSLVKKIGKYSSLTAQNSFKVKSANVGSGRFASAKAYKKEKLSKSFQVSVYLKEYDQETIINISHAISELMLSIDFKL